MNEKLKIGLLVESYVIPAWAFIMIQKINSSEYSEIVLIVKKVSEKEQPRPLYRLWKNRKTLFFNLYRKLETNLFKISPDAFELKDLKSIVNCKEIDITTKETEFNDIISNNDIKTIRSHNIDVFIKLGFKTLKGDILQSAKFGIWDYCFGGIDITKETAIGSWEVLENWDETYLLLYVLNDKIAESLKLYESFTTTDNVSILRNKNNVCWKASLILPRKLKELHTLGENKFSEKVKNLNTSPRFYKRKHNSVPNNLLVLNGVFRNYFRSLKNRIKALFAFEQWILLFKLDENETLSNSFKSFKRMLPPKDRFWADPFIIKKHGTYYIFIEELIYTENKGKISVIEMGEKGNYTPPKVVLEKDYHLSYPFIFEDNGNLYMIPESASNKTIELYKCSDFPFKWDLVKVLMHNITAVDSTIFKYNNKYWLFSYIKEHMGTSALEELCLFYSENLLTHDWKEHPCNPIVTDAKYARPAGNIFTHNGKIFRPSQNCSKHYGYGMQIREIATLNEKSYKEVQIQSIYPDWDKDVISTHTLNHTGNLTMIDALIKRSK